jgi:predicted DNA-binding protein (MmcQ/YjbR family)
MNSPLHKKLVPFRKFGLSLPEAREEFPFGHSVLKVKGKIFVFFGNSPEGGPTIAVKLPESCEEALQRKCAAPTGYGLGRGGWVTVTLGKSDSPTPAMLKEWIHESYVAVAPRKLSAGLTASPGNARRGKNVRE